MGSIERYIFRSTFGAFLLVLLSLTGVIWITQALRDIDLMTNKGQSILVFVGITGLIVPLLVLVIAPIALVVAAIYILNKLSNDSEIIVLNAAGIAPMRLFRSFLAVGIVVSLGIAAISAYLAPHGLRQLRTWAMEVRTDLVANIIQPGRFTTIESRLVFHLRERLPNGMLLGIFVDDQRDPKERVTFLAEQGEILKNDDGTFLILESGSVQRLEAGRTEPVMVTFDRYAFDLSQFGGMPDIRYSTRERYLWELWGTSTDERLGGDPDQIRAELHDRLTSILYPIAFIIIAFAYLGSPRTIRQGRTMPMLSTISAVAVLRLTGMACTVLGVRQPWLLAVPYLLLAATIGFGLHAISRGTPLEPPVAFTDWLNRITERLTHRFSPGAAR